MKRKQKSLIIRRETYNQILRLLVLDLAEEAKIMPVQKKHFLSDSGVFIVHNIEHVRIVVRNRYLNK
jgi:hypothetical protein